MKRSLEEEETGQLKRKNMLKKYMKERNEIQIWMHLN